MHSETATTILTWEITMLLIGLVTESRADSIILNDGCRSVSGSCEVTLETLAGMRNSERDCKTFSTSFRTCFVKSIEPIKKNANAVVDAKIHSRDGETVLNWKDNEALEVNDENSARTSGTHVVPQSEWKLQPVFWRRTKRLKYRRKVITCRCSLRGYAKVHEAQSKEEEPMVVSENSAALAKEELGRIGECLNGLQARYETRTDNLNYTIIIRRIATNGYNRCATMCREEFVTQTDCIGVAFSVEKEPNCILLSSLPSRSTNFTDYTVYTSC
ncbi:hypothetical protein Q1695_001637 [Nippostrongylus brasiliensis]|nr:hypothetical protein Q1695_001637 [Nippostrongylus brasiliensis]